MQVVYHIGAHYTDEDRLLRCLLKNKGLLAKEGIIVPGPGKYRRRLRETLVEMRGHPAPMARQKDLLDAVLDQDNADRIVFSNQTLICGPARIVQRGRLYDMAGERVQWMTQILPDAESEFFLAMRNPATFFPAIAAELDQSDARNFVAQADPRDVRWSEVISQIRELNPNVPLTVWCNEDTPLIWPQLLRELAGHDAFTELEGVNDFLESLMSPAGVQRMYKYLESHPPATEVQRRRIVAAFLDKFALDEEIEVEVDMPGWSESLIAAATEIYEDDMLKVEQIPGVNFITP